MAPWKVCLAAVVFLSCGKQEVVDRCRDPSVLVFDTDSCSTSLHMCESEALYDIDCDNSTFSGDFECSCSSIGRGAFGGYEESTFTSPDICAQPEAEIAARAIDGCGWKITIVDSPDAGG